MKLHYNCKILLFVFSVLVSACSSTPKIEEKQYLIEDMPLDSVQMELWFPELMAVDLRNIVSINNKLCLVGPDEDNLLYLIDETNGKEIGNVGATLQGPEDMSPYPRYVGKSLEGNRIFLYDFNTRRMHTYELDTDNGHPKMKLLEKKNLLNSNTGGIQTSYLSICRLDNGYYVGLSYLSHTHLFTLLDNELNLVTEFATYPLEGLTTDGSMLNAAGQTFEGTLFAFKNSVYYAAKKFGYMARYDISDNGEATLIWDNFYNKVSYKIDNSQIKFKGQSNQHGFSDMVVGKEYIFATYSGELTGKMFEERNTYAIEPETLVVLTHDGEPVGRFKLNSHSFVLGLSENEDYLYIHNNDPEVQIMRIRTSDILEKI
ncbi:MAG: hypothetical protein IJX29_03610 [Bacteroides sp.]|nr:hypothetical protein [Bacteroides sp.]